MRTQQRACAHPEHSSPPLLVAQGQPQGTPAGLDHKPAKVSVFGGVLPQPPYLQGALGGVPGQDGAGSLLERSSSSTSTSSDVGGACAAAGTCAGTQMRSRRRAFTLPTPWEQQQEQQQGDQVQQQQTVLLQPQQRHWLWPWEWFSWRPSAPSFKVPPGKASKGTP